jgi:hypothetical protein
MKDETNFVEKDHLQKLRHQLEQAGVDISVWGKGEAKTLEALYQELEKGESFLQVVDGRLELLRYVVSANVYYTTKDGLKLRLQEDKQIFQDGRIRHRNFDDPIADKMKPGEDQKTAMLRCLEEELGLVGDFNLKQIKQYQKKYESQSYPGLESQYITYSFAVFLNDEQFQESGYIEKQDDKSTYFVWEEVK